LKYGGPVAVTAPRRSPCVHALDIDGRDRRAERASDLDRDGDTAACDPDDDRVVELEVQ